MINIGLFGEVLVNSEAKYEHVWHPEFASIVVHPVRKLHKGASSFCMRFATMSQLLVQDFFWII